MKHASNDGIGVMIAGGACPATALVGHEVIQSARRTGNRAYILRDGLNSLLSGSEPEFVDRHKESYVFDLMAEASRDYVGDKNAALCAQSLQRLRREYGINVLNVIGGDGTAAGLHRILATYTDDDKPSVALAPKTIDGDVLHSDTTVGHATAIAEVDRQMRAFRRDSFKMKRVLFTQVPGRDAGHLALRGGEGHADIILIKEAPFAVEEIAKQVRDIYKEQRYCLISVAEGFEPTGIDSEMYKYTDKQGNNGRIAIAEYLCNETKKVMSDLMTEGKTVNYRDIGSEGLRGAIPVQEDRELATDLGVSMSEHQRIHKGKPYELAFVVQEGEIVPIPLADIAQGFKPVDEKDYHPGGMYINHHKQPL